jgi:hypothetical protein
MRFISSVQRHVRDWLSIPTPNARVHPALFPEADYPVFCMRCGYDLRGLSEQRCPECGEQFERGQLLVEQYVRCRRPHSDLRYRLARRIGRLGWVLIIGAITAHLSLAILLAFWSESLGESMMCRGDLLIRAMATVLGAQFLGAVLLGLSSCLWWSVMPQRTKRRAIRDALKASRRTSATRPREGAERPV